MLIRLASIVAIVTFAFSASAEESSVVTSARVPAHVAKSIEQPPPNVPPHPVQLTNGTDLGPSEFGQKQKLLEQMLGEQKILQRRIEQLRIELQVPQQILVRVRMLEVSHTKMRKMGFDANLLSKGYLTVADSNSLRSAAAKTLADPLAKPVDLSGHNALPAFVDFLVQNNLAKVLAEPTILTLVGHPAKFNVGGEIPIPARDGSAAAVEFRPYGTTVDILTSSLGGNRLRMELRVCVAELDESHPIHVGATSVPSLSVRRIDTGVEIRANESVALGGLVERRTEKVKNGQADNLASDEEETELMVVVTPELVQPSN